MKLTSKQKAMEVTVVVIYRQALAHYTVAVKNETLYEAGLLKYGGSSHDLPPPRIRFLKQGRHCTGDTDEQDLMDDLYHAVQVALTTNDDAPSAGHNPGTPYVSI
jgi:hypothetical protein